MSRHKFRVLQALLVQPAPLISQANVSTLIAGMLGLSTVIVGVIAVIYNDKLAGAGIITAGLGVLTHALSSSQQPLPAATAP